MLIVCMLSLLLSAVCDTDRMSRGCSSLLEACLNNLTLNFALWLVRSTCKPLSMMLACSVLGADLLKRQAGLSGAPLALSCLTEH